MNKTNPIQQGLSLIIASLIAIPSTGHAQETERILYDTGGDPFGDTLNFWSAPSAPENWLGAQQFYTDDLGYVSTFNFILAKWNSGTSGELTWQIWDSINDEPGKPLATIGKTETSTLPSSSTGGQVITLSVPPMKLEPNSPYYLVLDLTNVPTPNANQTVAGGMVNNNASGTRGATGYLIADTPQPGAPLEWINVADLLGTDSTHFVLQATVSHRIVTNLDDSGPGSLRQALADASPNTVITFDPSLDGGTITLGGEQLVIEKNLTIDVSSLPSGITIDANRESRVLKIEPEITVSLHGLTLTRGFAPNGGGIHNERSHLALSNCAIINNDCDAYGGGIFNDTGSSGTGTLTLKHCTLSQNTAADSGAIHSGRTLQGLDEFFGKASLTLESCLLENNRASKNRDPWELYIPDSEGGAISSVGGGSEDAQAGLHLKDCTITNNHSIRGGGIYVSNTRISLDDCTFTRNSAGTGGGIYASSSIMSLKACSFLRNKGRGIDVGDEGFTRASSGGGMTVYASDLTMNLCTIANCSANTGGGIHTGNSNVTLEACTLARNFATILGNGGFIPTISDNQGGGIYGDQSRLTLKRCTLFGNSTEAISTSLPEWVHVVEDTGNGGGLRLTGTESVPSTLMITDSIIAGNSAVEGSDFFLGDHTSVTLTGQQLISDLTGSGLTEGPNIIVANPRLAPLGDYGGPTQTMPPLPGSPAIDSGGNSTPGATDQRDFLIVGQRDLGAVEYQGDADYRKVFDVDSDGDGNSFGIESALGTDPFTPDQSHPNNLGAPIFNAEAQPVLTFGLGEDAHPDTTWILERSTDLATFKEIYAFDGTTDFITEGIPIEVNRTAERVTITDEAPPTKGAYYRFKAFLSDRN